MLGRTGRWRAAKGLPRMGINLLTLCCPARWARLHACRYQLVTSGACARWRPASALRRRGHLWLDAPRLSCALRLSACAWTTWALRPALAAATCARAVATAPARCGEMREAACIISRGHAPCTAAGCNRGARLPGVCAGHASDAVVVRWGGRREAPAALATAARRRAPAPACAPALREARRPSTGACPSSAVSPVVSGGRGGGMGWRWGHGERCV